MLIPTVIERTDRGERAYDVYSRLLQERIVFFGTELDADVANVIIAQMLHLQAEDPDKDIRLYINSPGGDMNALFAIYDTMQVLSCDVSTVCIGQAASAAAVILAGGARVQALAEDTGQDATRIQRDIDRDFILRGDEAVAYGLVDEVLSKPPARGEPRAAR